MSKGGKCTSDYSPMKCNGIDIPDDCTYADKGEVIDELKPDTESTIFEDDIKKSVNEDEDE